ncbi:MAG: hypothetical protein JSV79_03345 [Armatimonadota bacterium]|nr:MAG: hypothetical protein JSV79_03345 [Armatimonadota bacterium]
MSAPATASWLAVIGIVVTGLGILVSSLGLGKLAEAGLGQHLWQLNRMREKEEFVARHLTQTVHAGVDHIEEMVLRCTTLLVHAL